MKTYLILLRGINVGGKNKIPMAELRRFLEEQGFEGVATYIQSGNVILQSDLEPEVISQKIETSLSKNFQLDSEIIRVLVLTKEQLRNIVKNKPKGFGDFPDKYHSDVIFLIGVKSSEAMTAFSPRAGVDKVWLGQGVVYSERLSSQRTKSRLNKIMATPFYKSMTVRNWNTTTKLLLMMGNL